MMRISAMVLMAGGIAKEMSLLAASHGVGATPPWTKLRGDGGGASDRRERVQPVTAR